MIEFTRTVTCDMCGKEQTKKYTGVDFHPWTKNVLVKVIDNTADGCGAVHYESMEIQICNACAEKAATFKVDRRSDPSGLYMPRKPEWI